MADIPLSECTVFEECGQATKTVIIRTAATVDATDVITPITLANYGITNLLYVKGFVHTATDSVIAVEVDTTSVTSGVLSVTIAAGTNDDVRVIEICGY